MILDFKCARLVNLAFPGEFSVLILLLLRAFADRSFTKELIFKQSGSYFHEERIRLQREISFFS
jgi:hypothetical protein